MAVKLANWQGVPWGMLMMKSHWSASFLFTMSWLERLLGDGVLADRVSMSFETYAKQLQKDTLHISSEADSSCPAATEQRLKRVAAVAQEAEAAAQNAVNSSRQIKINIVHNAHVAIFSEGGQAFACDVLHPLLLMLLFAEAIRPILPSPPPEETWPEVTQAGPAGPAHGSDIQPEESQVIYRFCDDQEVVHRKVGRADLHFLAADVLEVGGEYLLEVLWFASSDDRCVMAGATETGIHGDKAYYSFAHTLPRAHLQHWHCDISTPGISRAGMWPGNSAVTLSFSGFDSVTSCRVPSSVKNLMLQARSPDVSKGTSENFVEGPDPPGVELELKLLSKDSGKGLQPEPLRLCPVRAPLRRRISACTSLLHGADRMHNIMPFLVEDWINYHVMLGIEHFTVYDTDGSYEPYLATFVEHGRVTYHARWPGVLSTKLGLLSAGVKAEHLRPMLTEPQALDACVWHYRHVSDWVVGLHSFEEFLHSPLFSQEFQSQAEAATNEARDTKVLPRLLERWASQVAGKVALFEVFQEVMGGPVSERSTSTLSAWTHKRNRSFEGERGRMGFVFNDAEARPFTWIVDPLNVIQTAIHMAKPRSPDLTVVTLPTDLLRVNHYVNLGSNSSRCSLESTCGVGETCDLAISACNVPDRSILWAEPHVIAMRGGLT